MDYGGETIKRQTWAMYGCLVAGQSPVTEGLAYGQRPLCLWHNSAAAAAVAAYGAI